MPRFHLHLHNTHVDADDEQGHDLPDLAAARAMAIEGIRGFLSHELAEGRLDLRGQIDIAMDDGAVIESIFFDEAVKVMARPAN